MKRVDNSKTTDFKTFLLKLNKNLNILQEREAKHAGNAPLDLINQIEDHKQALDLTRQVITDELSESEWREALKPLLVAIGTRSGEAAIEITYQATLTGRGGIAQGPGARTVTASGGGIAIGGNVGGDVILGERKKKDE